MGNPGLDAATMQEALDLYEKYDRNYSAGARAANLPRQTFENRVNRALMGGLKPRVTREYAKPTKLGR